MHQYTTVSSNYKPKKKGFSVVDILVWIITALIGWAIFTNIKPYEVLATNFLVGVNYPVFTFFTKLPLIGGFLKFIWSFLGLGLGTLLWAFFQLLELLPLALFGHQAFINNSLKRANGKKYENAPADEWEVKVAKIIGNSLSTEVLRFLILLGIAVYVLDFFLCLYVFPPVRGGTVGDLFQVFYTGQMNRLDWGNIFIAVCTVCAVEVLFKLRVLMVKIAEDLKSN